MVVFRRAFFRVVGCRAVSTAVAASRDRLRRAVLFVPGDKLDKFMPKALASSADTIVVDLEDGVAPGSKAAARAAVRAWLGSDDRAATAKEIVVRVNHQPEDLLVVLACEEDLAAVFSGAGRVDALMIPKVGGAACLDAVARAVAGREMSETPFIPIATEVAAGLVAIHAIAGHPRVAALTWGAEDLAAVLGAKRKYVDPRANPGRGTYAKRYLPIFEFARTQCLLAAKANGAQAIDGVYTALKDLRGLRAEADDAAMLGFDGRPSWR